MRSPSSFRPFDAFRPLRRGPTGPRSPATPPVIPLAALITQDGQPLVTQDGNYLIAEAGGFRYIKLDIHSVWTDVDPSSYMRLAEVELYDGLGVLIPASAVYSENTVLSSYTADKIIDGNFGFSGRWVSPLSELPFTVEIDYGSTVDGERFRLYRMIEHSGNGSPKTITVSVSQDRIEWTEGFHGDVDLHSTIEFADDVGFDEVAIV